jgi:ribosome biogenesis protein BMS1
MSGNDILAGLKSNRKHKKAKPRGGKGPTDPSKKNRKNNKAFGVTNVVSTKRNIQRNLDRAQKKEVVPLVNREEELPPPTMVVVMGPKGVGKSTLIRSLVKMYTNQNLTDTVGPITVIAGKKKRFTFFEAPLDMYSMTDLAKVSCAETIVEISALLHFVLHIMCYYNM